MEIVQKSFFSRIGWWLVWGTVLTCAVLCCAGPLSAQSMMEYSLQQSAAQATAKQALAPVSNNSDAYAGQILEPQNTAAGKLIREDIPIAFVKMRDLFIDIEGKPKWGTIVAILALLLVFWRLGRPS